MIVLSRQDREDLATSHLAKVRVLVWKFIKNYHPPSFFSQEDLVAVGNFHLWQCALRYDPNHEQEANFSTYMGRRVWGSLVDHLRSTNFEKHHGRSASAQSKGSKSYYFVPIDGVSVDPVEGCLPADSPLFQQSPHPIEDMDFQKRLDLVLKCPTLDARERLILEAKLDGWTQRQIGVLLRVSETRACQLSHRTMRKISEYLAVENEWTQSSISA